MECYDVPDRFAVGARCVEPGYEVDFCGVLTTGLKLQSQPPSLDCSPVYDPFEVLKRTPHVLSAISE
ncbi:MAG: hypothetical protein MUP63_03590 [Candidatus Nanohaloarchaeota archaeon QJJ-7]|nr:hypothetical protein [Candidatus Nanohaloarchaeota archaeon QJJ-7]